MSRPKIFLGSASESRVVADALEAELRTVSHVERWDLDVFRPGHFTLDELTRTTAEVDFAVFVLGREDQTSSRGTILPSPRDNVVFEAGLFTAAIGRERTFYLVPKEGTKIPSDWNGLGYLTYDATQQRSRDQVFEATRQIAAQIEKLGTLRRSVPLTPFVGHWWQFVENVDHGAVLSLIQLAVDASSSASICLEGSSWSKAGAAVARYWSRAAEFEASRSMLSYFWEGEHPKKGDVPSFFGVGEIRFLESGTQASGWYSTSPSAKLESTHLRSTRYSRATPADVQTMSQGSLDDRERTLQARLRERDASGL
ncbi:MAG: nucleotide-binding protein [Deltaproteobacteria bacterium]|nr:nucleotide-binding protein [Deltaproteobacteria bacterium]